MGQHLNNPPSVEGWHQGVEWLDTGTLVERINFASEQVGDLDKPGVKTMVGNIASRNGEAISSQSLVDLCLEQMGDIQVTDASREILVDFAEQADRSPEASWGAPGCRRRPTSSSDHRRQGLGQWSRSRTQRPG